MRRWILFLLCLILLTGCAPQLPQETAPSTDSASTTEETQTQPTVPLETEPEGLYVADSQMETQTQGALREYRIASGIFSGLAPLGDGLLLFTTQEHTTLTLLMGENLTPVASAELDCVLALPDASVQIGEDGLGYYDDTRQAVVLLDADLQETASFALPADMLGRPALSPDRTQVYYCAGSEIRVLDLQTGISRLLKQTAYSSPYIVGLFCGGSVLEVCGIGDDSALVTLFLSVEDGQTRCTAEQPPNLATWGNWYFAKVQEDSASEIVFGETGGEARSLYPAGAGGTAVALAANSCLVYTPDEGGCTLDFYDLTEGKRIASEYVPGLGDLWDLTLDSSGQVVYFRDSGSDGASFYAWYWSQSEIADKTVYTDTYYTAENPDVEGLAACVSWAERLEHTYGVDIRLWEEALALQPEGYSFVGEYRVSAYQRDLAVLEQALSRYPEGFFLQAARETDSGTLRICLAREIQGDPAWGNLETVGGVQFWDGNDAYIALTLGSDLEQNFYHEMSHVIDNRVMGTSGLYDDWSDLNPDGFEYDYDYIVNQQREAYSPLEEERAFIDSYAMSFPKEDRARIMEYAMLPDQESYFRSEIMQRKLRRICLAIRDAFELEEYPEALPWEQYLQEPLIPDA